MSEFTRMIREALVGDDGAGESVDASEVRVALERIDKGEYGSCARCGNDIAPARLMAIPHTEFCITCVQAQES